MTARIFDHLPDGKAVTAYRLEGSGGAYVEILDYGATILGIHIPDRAGTLRDVVLGFDDISSYATSDAYMGATVGRHANRIGGGQFTLNGKTYSLDRNCGPNHLHGGFQSYHTRMFSAEENGQELRLSLLSPDGDQGYPGTLKFSVSFRFTEENALHIRYEGVSDEDTVVNLTNHSYFDLSDGADPMGQLLWLNGEYYAENDETNLPTGRLLPVTGSPFDFTHEKPLGKDLSAPHAQLLLSRGYDHNFTISDTTKPFATLYSEQTGIQMTATTNMPGVQLYTANNLGDCEGKYRRHYRAQLAVCLETQFFPNAMAVENFEKPILKAGETYLRETIYTFSIPKRNNGNK